MFTFTARSMLNATPTAADCSADGPSRDRAPFASGIAAVIAGVVFALACAVTPRADARSIAVVFAPGTTFPQAAAKLALLDARIARIGRLPNIFVARFEKGWSFAAIWRIGALLPLDADAAGDCGVGNPKLSSSTLNAAY